MSNLPKVLITTVIRLAKKGGTHGSIYLIDLEEENIEKHIPWDHQAINWDGRGAGRGLRGIAFYNDKIYIASSRELLEYTKEFKLINRYSNQYLEDCHEIYQNKEKLYLTSTGYDSILIFDYVSKTFKLGYCIRYKGETEIIKLVRRIRRKFFKGIIDPRDPQKKYEFFSFSPSGSKGPPKGDTIHLNSIYVNKKIFFAGQKNIHNLLSINNGVLTNYSELKTGTHNAVPYKNNVIYNNTSKDNIHVINKNGKILETFNIIKYNESRLTNTDVPKNYARQAFGRGLTLTKDGLIIGGSSPATVSVYRKGSSKPIKTFNISKDIRHAIHGLEIWPYN